jgi:hypothetical protein
MEQPATSILPFGALSSAIFHVRGQKVALMVIRGPQDLPGDAEASASQAQLQPEQLLEQLVAAIVELNRLLGDTKDQGSNGSGSPEQPSPATKKVVDLPRPPTSGFTLKAVSRRTGIPAGTLRTWERRYGFLRPERSQAGYRIYGEDEIARIEQIKYLLGQGFRIGTAMEAVTGAGGGGGASEYGARSG